MQTREAVERGLLKGLPARGINASSMDISVTSVKFEGKRAIAVVSFAPKGGKISDGLTLPYTLEQRDGEWAITGHPGMNVKQHAGGMQVPPSMMDQNAGADRPLPAGHPPIDGAPQ
jgi:hypothetical protein